MNGKELLQIHPAQIMAYERKVYKTWSIRMKTEQFTDHSHLGI